MLARSSSVIRRSRFHTQPCTFVRCRPTFHKQSRDEEIKSNSFPEPPCGCCRGDQRRGRLAFSSQRKTMEEAAHAELGRGLLA